mmetsp:Transcript_5022/g.10143  ORF Transcript_5022/g.10143 Transcript_5022/m.10143 type:complete len:446 (-) Transcript_5022:1536-2873(-)
MAMSGMSFASVVFSDELWKRSRVWSGRNFSLKGPRCAHGQEWDEVVHREFSVLNNDGSSLAMLANAGQTLMPRRTWQAMDTFYRTDNAAVYHGVCASTLVKRSASRVDAARESLRHLVSAHEVDKGHIMWVRNTAEAVNLVVQSWAVPQLRPGDEVILSVDCSHDMILPWQRAAQRHGWVIKYMKLTQDGSQVDILSLPEQLNSRTRVIALAPVSSVLGSLNPVMDVIDFAKMTGCRVLLDGTHTVGRMPIDAGRLGCDWLVGWGGSMLGPTGIGFLYCRSELLHQMVPFLVGGCQSLHDWEVVGVEGMMEHERFESGMIAMAEAVGLGETSALLDQLGMNGIAERLAELGDYMYQQLSRLEGVHVIGPSTQRQGFCSFVVEGVDHHDLARSLAKSGVLVEVGHHGMAPLHRALNIESSLLASAHIYNTTGDVDRLVAGLQNVTS